MLENFMILLKRMKNLTEIIDYISPIIIDSIVIFSGDEDQDNELYKSLITLLYSNSKHIVTYNSYCDSYNINFEKIKELFNKHKVEFTFDFYYDSSTKERYYILHELNINSKYKFT